MVFENLLAFLASGALAVGSGGYVLHFHRGGDGPERLGVWSFRTGFLLQTIYLGWLTAMIGSVPLSSPVLWALCAWLVAIVYLYLESTTRDLSLGALVVPIVTLLHLVTTIQMLGLSEIPTVAYSGHWFEAHVLADILAYAGFAISCVSSVMYVLLLDEIQKKHLGYFYERLPALDTLDQANSRAATFGFVFLTVGLFSSSMWAHDVLGRLWIWSEPAFAPLLLTWAVFGLHLVARSLSGWGGKRAAVLSIVGFVLVLFSFPVVGVLFSGRHSFGAD
jgi:ABC-type transport system involved in cytochrome c biogenesis permease subunit